ncbi:hypothetical protein CBS147343_9698 [Aspergillus niger]|nr:hypothetical protein CBS133816_8744 [Aspergillus niger]KAI2840610.1 hypothetical protein CBS11350_6913 [Aspergillus niger]KAI2858024.1 hypothetical protein CBS12448_6305 [Aspergillus niger]KAI2891325.1 hypothetical protein CBS11852_6142 [Aspergillus niger]KAI2914539.1 hypothetical protein CBS147371_6224 [Aspergillus niger]
MPHQYIVSLKKESPPEELEKAKKTATDNGGKIVKEFALVKGFVVQYDDEQVSTLESSDHIHVEKDSEVSIQ